MTRPAALDAQAHGEQTAPADPPGDDAEPLEPRQGGDPALHLARIGAERDEAPEKHVAAQAAGRVEDDRIPPFIPCPGHWDLPPLRRARRPRPSGACCR